MHPDDVVAKRVACGDETAAVRAHVAGVRDVPRLNVLVEVGVVLSAVVALGALPRTQAFHHLAPDLGLEICKQKRIFLLARSPWHLPADIRSYTVSTVEKEYLNLKKN